MGFCHRGGTFKFSAGTRYAVASNDNILGQYQLSANRSFCAVERQPHHPSERQTPRRRGDYFDDGMAAVAIDYSITYQLMPWGGTVTGSSTV